MAPPSSLSPACCFHLPSPAVPRPAGCWVRALPRTLTPARPAPRSPAHRPRSTAKPATAPGHRTPRANPHFPKTRSECLGLTPKAFHCQIPAHFSNLTDSCSLRPDLPSLPTDAGCYRGAGEGYRGAGEGSHISTRDQVLLPAELPFPAYLPASSSRLGPCLPGPAATGWSAQMGCLLWASTPSGVPYHTGSGVLLGF